MSHTKEPWEHIPESRGSFPFVVTDANGEREAFYVDHSNGDQIARRIVACVNACAGLPTEVLEAEMKCSAPIFSLLVEARQQRDELLAALVGVLPFLTGNYWPGVEADVAVDHAVAIVRKTEECVMAPKGHNVEGNRRPATADLSRSDEL